MRELYKLDDNGNVRVWSMEQVGADYRTHSGVQGGKIVVSGWKTAKGKNVGRSNETSPEAQAGLEVERKYLDQLETGGYYETVEAAREGLTSYFQPMLAHKWPDELKRNKGEFRGPYWSQPKLDGIRCIATRDGLKSRNGKPLVATPHVSEALREAFEKNPDLVLDGELYNHTLKHDFEKIVSLVRKTKPTEEDFAESRESVHYHVYDVFDRARPGLPFRERVGVTNMLFTDDHYCLKKVDTSLVTSGEELDELYGRYLEAGYEGQMVRKDGPYEQDRSRNLLKRKEFEDAEFTVEYVEEGVGNWAGAVKRVYIRLEDGTVQKSGVRGTYDVLAEYLSRKDDFPGTEVTVRFQGRTADNKLRFPVVVAFWQGSEGGKRGL